MGVIRYFYNSHSFIFPEKSDEICFGIILKRNFELPAIFSGETPSGYKMKYA